MTVNFFRALPFLRKKANLEIFEDEVILYTVLVIASIAALALIYGLYCFLRAKALKKISYTRQFSEKGSYQGDEILLIETITNKSLLPLFFVTIEYYIYNQLQYDGYELSREENMQYATSRFFLIMPFMRIKRKHRIRLLKRGFYQLDTITASCTKAERLISAPASIYVYPALMKTDDLPIPASTLQGDANSRTWLIKDPFSLSGIREYRFGDSFNSINFKATAKSGKVGFEGIRVNNRDFCSNRNLMVYLNFQTDGNAPMAGHYYERLMEKGLSYSAAILRDAFDYGYRVGFSANSTLLSGESHIYYPMTQGAVNYEEILRQMSLVMLVEGGSSFSSIIKNDIIRGMCDSEVLIISTYCNETIDAAANQLRRYGNNVTIILLGEIG